jgi:alpha-glucosidase
MDRWWRDAVIYEVYVRSFADGNGDGVGDLLGVRSRLPYLRQLGVDALWLTPFYPSPLADGGYDVSDHRDVHPRLGTLGDARALIAEAHALGLRVIVDVVPNHTSDQHPWFLDALAAPPGDEARDRYLFRDGRGPDGAEPPNDWESVFGGPAWTRVPDGQWYLHLFAPEQPDLNWRHPAVRAEFAAILEFWLDLGVDGFRVDVAHGLFKDPALPDVGHTGQAALLSSRRLPYFDRDEVHEVYREWRHLLDRYGGGDRVAVAEAWVPSPERLARYVRPDELHQAFNFHLLSADFSALAWGRAIEESLRVAGSVGAAPTWVLSNHDVRRHRSRYGAGADGLRRARAAALLVLALPGSAYLYQGEELGLPEVEDLPEGVLTDPVWERSGRTERGRDGCRVPLPWIGSAPPFGFGPPGGDPPWLPIPAEWADLTVETQTGDPASTLSLYRAALVIRRAHPALGDGALGWGEGPPDTLYFRREPGFACTANLGAVPVELPAPGELLLASGPLGDGAGGAVLPPDTVAWWRT